jgi:hypothetical protein
VLQKHHPASASIFMVSSLCVSLLTPSLSLLGPTLFPYDLISNNHSCNGLVTILGAGDQDFNL